MTEQQKKTAGLAITSLVFGILSIACVGIFGAIPAVICGHLANGKIKRSMGALQGEGLALAGLIMGYVSIGITAVIIPVLMAIAVPNFIKARAESQRNCCIANMKQIEAAVNSAKLSGTTAPTAGDIFGNDKFISGMLTCPASKALYKQLDPPACPGNEAGHEIPKD